MPKSLAVLLCIAVVTAACGTSDGGKNELPDWDAPATRDGGVDGAVETSGEDGDEAVTDTAITSEVKAALLGDDRIALFKIQVRTDNGIVLLNGDVPSRSDAARAVLIAQRAEGVRKVVDNLHVH